MQRLGRALRSHFQGVSQAIVPAASELGAFAALAADAVRSITPALDSANLWQASLAFRMSRIQPKWALKVNLESSLFGFARIARLHDISCAETPFGAAYSELFADELGKPVVYDYRQSQRDRQSAQNDAGLNANVIAFPNEAYPAVLFSAGFQLKFEKRGSVVAESGEIGHFDPGHAHFFSDTENNLREFIQRELIARDPTGWMRRRIHGNMLQRWLDRKSADEVKRGDSFPIIYYADFMDLMQIIIDGKNWQEIFARFFTSKADFQVSMERLGPVRNAIGHSRPLIRGDQLILYSEGTRILTAVGIRT